MKVEKEILGEIRVISANAKSKSPEEDVFNFIMPFAQENGILEDNTRIFGFNDPNPDGPDSVYGYTIWIETDKKIDLPESITNQVYPGGVYLTTLVTGVENIFPTWQELGKYAKANGLEYNCNAQWLEEHISVEGKPNEFVLKLMMPIK